MTIRHLSLALTALLTLLVLPARGQDAPKMATVDMQHLFREYHRTDEAQKQINVERARIQKENNQRLSRIGDLEKELKKLREDLENPAISDKKKQELFRDFQNMTQEGVALDKERREFLERRNKSLNEKMVQRMKGILAEIHKLVKARAKAGKYKLLFDKSALSTSQVPFLLHSDIDDLTEGVLTELNKDAGKGE